MTSYQAASGWMAVLMFLGFMVEVWPSGVFLSDEIYSSVLEPDYRKEVKPRCADEPAVNVVMDLALRQIIELNEPKQILQTNVWLRVTWRDCRLAWNKTQFGVDKLILPSSAVWTPDVTLYDNSGDEGLAKVAKEYRVSVTHEGNLRHQIPVVLESLCRIDNTYFPFDRQSCPLTFGLWAYNGLEVNMSSLSDAGDLNSYKRHTEWKIDSFLATRRVGYFKDVPYPTIEYMLEIRRKPLFFVLNLFFPCVLISMVAVLGFLLPPDAGEKVNLEITVLLSLAVFQLIVLEMMPPNSETLPFISVYFATTMILVGMSCFLTVIVLNIHFKGNQGFRVPPFVKYVVVEKLGRILCVKVHRKRKRFKSDDPVQCLKLERRKSSMKKYSAPTEAPPVDSGPAVNSVTSVLFQYFQQINENLNDIVSHISDKKKEKALCEEWELVALVLDRTFLLIYGLCSVITLLVFMSLFLSQ